MKRTLRGLTLLVSAHTPIVRRWPSRGCVVCTRHPANRIVREMGVLAPLPDTRFFLRFEPRRRYVIPRSGPGCRPPRRPRRPEGPPELNRVGRVGKDQDLDLANVGIRIFRS